MKTILRCLAVLCAVTVPALTAQEYADFLPEHPLRWESATATGAASRVAVIVTADEYRADPTWNLPSAKRSGELLRDALVKHGGVARDSVVLLSGERVHAGAVEDAIATAAARVGAAESAARPAMLIVAWVGHGWTEQKEQRLLGYYSQRAGERFQPAIGQSQLLAWLRQAQQAAGKRGVDLATMLLVDACRPNVGAPPGDAVGVRDDAWQVFGAKLGRLVAAGSGGEAFAFSGAFIEALQMRAQQAATSTLAEVFKQARDLTVRGTRNVQEPELLEPEKAERRASIPNLVVPRRVGFGLRLVDALTGGRVEGGRAVLDDTELVLGDAQIRLAGAPGAHQLEVRADGYLTRTESLTLGDGEADRELVMPLLPQVMVLRGRLTPPRVAHVRAVVAGARAGFHTLEADSDREGVFSLRVPGVRDLRLQIVQRSRVVQTATPAITPAAWLRDRPGRHSGIAVADLVVALDKAALDALGADAAVAALADDEAPKAEPTLADRFDRTEWLTARQRIAESKWELARVALAGVQEQSGVVDEWRRYVDGRWARHTLELALELGRTVGQWPGADEVIAWWATKPQVKNADEVARLLAELERERVPLSVRQGFEAGNHAFAAGELEKALDLYQAARGEANAHYGVRIDEQMNEIRARLFARHLSAGSQHEADGDAEKALESYTVAFRYNLLRARRYMDRLLKDPVLAATPAGVEATKVLQRHSLFLTLSQFKPSQLAVKPPPEPAPDAAPKIKIDVFGWASEILDPTLGKVVAKPRRVRDKRSGVEFILVEPGEFMMGSDAGDPDEKPVHRVRLTRGYYMAATETTIAQWRVFAQATGYRTTAEQEGTGLSVTASGGYEAVKGAHWADPFPNLGVKARDDWPAVHISWNDAQAYVRWLGGERLTLLPTFRLPTEAEWEYACRAGTTTANWWGTDAAGAKGRANVADAGTKNRFATWPVFPFDDGHPLLAPVGSFAANPWGFHDMLGNAWEWCSDIYSANGYQGSEGGVDDPRGPLGLITAPRTSRGCSWDSAPQFLRASNRNGGAPGYSFSGMGFRAVRSL